MSETEESERKKKHLKINTDKGLESLTLIFYIAQLVNNGKYML